jgi:O-antigen ligase
LASSLPLPTKQKTARRSFAFWAVTLLLVAVFLFGGSARSDVQSLVILRVVAIFGLGAAILTMKREQLAAHRFLISLAGAIALLTGIYLLPLPEDVLHALRPSSAGNDLSTLVAALSGRAETQLALNRGGALDSLLSLSVPAAVLAWTIQLPREERFQLLPLIMFLALLSALVGLLQIIGDPQGPLYLYNTTNFGSAVGLFANRNHQAVLLAMLLPIVAVFSATSDPVTFGHRYGKFLLLAAIIIIFPLILVTGSRAGLIIAVIGLAFALLVPFGESEARTRSQSSKAGVIRKAFLPLAVLTIGGLIALSIFSNRATALFRLVAPSEADSGRLAFWQPVLNMSLDYLPTGTGPGSFTHAYAIIEPYSQLDQTYLNHAHNDWLELFASFGIAGTLVAIVAAAAFARCAFRLLVKTSGSRRTRIFGLLGITMIVMVTLSSIGDYPARTPIFQALLVIAAVWANGQLSRKGD